MNRTLPTTCAHGHSRWGYLKNGRRYCIECLKLRQQDRRKRLRAEAQKRS